jgi:hypothetical protein
LEIWLEGMEIEEVNLLDVEIGDALNEADDERAVGKIPLSRGINIDSEGVETDVYFIWHDVSDQQLADDYGKAWAGALEGVNPLATSFADYNEVTGVFTFYGDLPNPVRRRHADFLDLNGDAPPHDDLNDYSPLRQVEMDGKDVIVNTFFIQWGNEVWEQLRIDVNCDPDVPGTFPDNPPNTSCMYNGETWSGDTGHAVEINVDADEPYVRMKLHKSWTDNGDYLPYYIVVDTYPAGPADAMGIIYVPKHQFLGLAAVPLVQFIPPSPIAPSYPPTGPVTAFLGGGPLGGQIGLPSYFMPEARYSPMWHIGFAHWTTDNIDEIFVVKGLEELKWLRKEGRIMIGEFPPPPNMWENNYDFESENSPHVVNCPTPMTIDMALHRARKLTKPNDDPAPWE